MLTQSEREQIQLKALEQAIQAAKLAKADITPLLPMAPSYWPFVLTQDDCIFLKIQKISFA